MKTASRGNLGGGQLPRDATKLHCTDDANHWRRAHQHLAALPRGDFQICNITRADVKGLITAGGCSGFRSFDGTTRAQPANPTHIERDTNRYTPSCSLRRSARQQPHACGSDPHTQRNSRPRRAATARTRAAAHRAHQAAPSRHDCRLCRAPLSPRKRQRWVCPSEPPVHPWIRMRPTPAAIVPSSPLSCGEDSSLDDRPGTR